MFGRLFDSNDKQINKIKPIVSEINKNFEKFEQLSESEIKQKTQDWKNELKELSEQEQNEYLDKLKSELKGSDSALIQDALSDAEEYLRTVMTLHIADCYCQDNGFGFVEGYAKTNGFFQKCLSELQIQPCALNLILKDVHQEIQKYTDTGILE